MSYSYRDQVFSWNDLEVSVPALIEACKELGIQHHPVTRYDHVFDQMPWGTLDYGEFIEHHRRTNEADLTIPIIVIDTHDSDSPRPGLVIADGLHRLAKAIATGEETIPVYVLPHSVFLRIAR